MQRSFRPRALIPAGLPLLVLMAGCGGSKHAAPGTTNPTAPGPATSTGRSATSSTQRTAPGAPSTTTSSRATSSTSNPTGGAGLPSGSSSGGSGGSSNARVPATFIIAAGGRLSPPSVSAPAFLAVQLTIVSRDSRSHQVLLRTPTQHSLAVPAHGHASVLIPGLRAGHYPLELDGTARGALSIGGEPGP